MDAVFALILPLVGGFFIVREATFIKYQAAREDGHRLYFRITYYGFWLFLSSLLILGGLRSALSAAELPLYADFEDVVLDELIPLMKEGQQSAARVGFVAVCAFAMLLGRFSPRILNRLTKKSSLQALLDATSQNELEGLLIDAVATAKSVLVTLTTGKAYVGFVLSNAEPRAERRVIALLPLASGYRSDKSELVLTTFYDQIYSQNDAADNGDFRLVLSVDKIVSTAFFDFEIYEKFNAGKTDGIATSAG